MNFRGFTSEQVKRIREIAREDVRAMGVRCTCGGLCHTHVGLECWLVQATENALERAVDLVYEESSLGVEE